MKRLLLQLFILAPFVGYFVYSYTQADPNLVLSTFPLYWKAQEWLWQIGYHQRELSSWIYGGLLVGMIASCAIVIKKCTESEKKSTLLSIALLLLFSHNALSHDIFNYIFNARMVVKYSMDPHIHTALEFPSDDWTRFMHNTHTPAPYGYGWTLLSLVPVVLGMGKFLLTYFLMKAWVVVGFVLLWCAMKRLAVVLNVQKEYEKNKWLFFLNPLVLIETFSNAHNDAWMMAPAVLALSLVFHRKKNNKQRMIWMGVVVLLIISASIKFATLALIPLIGVIVLGKYVRQVNWIHLFTKYWAELGSLLLFLPLFTARSQQFHPWYLMWSLSFIPFLRLRWAQLALIAFSFSSLMRYAPYILVGDYTQNVLFDQRVITWVGGIVVGAMMFIWRMRYEKR